MKALITGGTGFLGGALARRLQRDGWDVSALGRNLALGQQLTNAGIRFIPADLRDRAAINAACAGQQIVFHCGAAVGTWGDPQEFYTSNVVGTDTLVKACQQHKIQRLIHVSTPSIYFATSDRLNVKEGDLLPSPINLYTATKLLAEGVIDRAHRDGLPVITLRPRAIFFGPGDTTIFPRLLTAIKSGRLRIIGDGQNVQDLSYIDNVVDALLRCVDSPAFTLGRKYNISNGEPVKFWELLKRLCEELGYAFPTRHLPVPLALGVAMGMESLYKLLRSKSEPPLTRYTVGILARSMTLDIAAAQLDLGYRPKVNVEEGMARFLGWWKAVTKK